MDILHLVKKDHDQIRAEMSALLLETSAGELRTRALFLGDTLGRLIDLKNDLLYPEAEGQGGQIDRALLRIRDYEKEIRTKLETLQNAEKQEDGDMKIIFIFKDLSILASAYFDFSEEWLLPRIRKIVSTVCREELGQVYADSRTDSFDFKKVSASSNWSLTPNRC